VGAPLVKRVAAEAVATAFLLAAVVGSGIMAARLAGGNAALALLANAIATGAALGALILAFGPVSGAHMNPVVTVIDARFARRPVGDVVAYLAAQLGGAIIGVVLANLMFELPAVTVSRQIRSGVGPWLAEGVATFGLVLVVFLVARSRPPAVAFAVGGYITAAYWFTSSTSFANPAVTIARALSDTFTGIRPADVPAFIVAEVVGAVAAAVFLSWLGVDRAVEAQLSEDRR
jgi:glycerol uptake facilitator-like aquaporin